MENIQSFKNKDLISRSQDDFEKSITNDFINDNRSEFHHLRKLTDRLYKFLKPIVFYDTGICRVDMNVG